jgi:hypothetical protein
MNQLTQEQTARIFALYLQCEARVSIAFGAPFRGSKIVAADILGVIDSKVHLQCYDVHGNKCEELHISELINCKLLLTPLCKITDEDAIEVAKINGMVNAKVVRKVLYIVLTDDSHCIYIHYNGRLQYSKNGQLMGLEYYDFIMQFLIQRGYAVPLFIAPNHPDNGKTAIELGIAIDKTKESV